jgi:outer membrane protein OmpA-like peptidoglycan-associated protein
LLSVEPKTVSAVEARRSRRKGRLKDDPGENMPKRTGYLASVAMPLISMSLMVPHAQAMPNMPQLERAYGASDIIRVQDAVSPPPAGAESEEELKKRRAPPAAEEQHQKAPPEAKPEARPEPKPEPKAEPRAAAPAPEAPAEPKARPAAREPVAEEPKAPEPKAPEPKAAEPKAPEPKAAEPKAPEPKAAEPKAREPVAADAPAARPQPPEPKPAEAKPAREKPAAEPEAQSRPAPAEAAPVAKPAPEKKPGEAPRPRPTDAQKPQPEAGEAPAPAVRPATPLSGEAPAPAARPAAPAAVAPAPVPGAKTPAVVAPDAPAPAAGQTPGQPPAPGARPVPPAPGEAAAPAAPNVASPTTPEQVERARKIAENPAASNQPIVLPVENGAAVLDSAKEAPAAAGRPGGPRDGQPRDGQRRDGQARDGQRRDGGPQAGQPGAQPQPVAPNTPPPPPPRSDADAQAGPAGRAAPPVRMEAITSERGERMRERPRYDMPAGFDGRDAGGPSDDGRIIINFDNRTIVRHDDSRRFYDSGYTPEYERLPGERTREIIARDNGVQIVTIRDRYGDVVQRSRIGEDGREYVLFYAPEQRQDRGPDYEWRDPADDLPPMRLTVPVSQYIIDTSTDPDRDYYKFLEQPPVERVERVYSLDEVRYSARIRDKVRRIDLDTITFATGSADIPMNQARSLRKVADAINEVLKKDPSETFLIEGHTDAVGSDESNLVLSDRRAEQVAVVLSDVYGIPPENMTTQGYGERYLKVNTDGPSQENRRVTIRRITALVKPVAQNR